ncbi:MAG: hypothetical protein K0T99_02890 [Alphaproteobacteria bacterium]|nr:hypothetical protein [Alphaproteobacteria bacterium]
MCSFSRVDSYSLGLSLSYIFNGTPIEKDQLLDVNVTKLNDSISKETLLLFDQLPNIPDGNELLKQILRFETSVQVSAFEELIKREYDEDELDLVESALEFGEQVHLDALKASPISPREALMFNSDIQVEALRFDMNVQDALMFQNIYQIEALRLVYKFEYELGLDAPYISIKDILRFSNDDQIQAFASGLLLEEALEL